MQRAARRPRIRAVGAVANAREASTGLQAQVSGPVELAAGICESGSGACWACANLSSTERGRVCLGATVGVVVVAAVANEGVAVGHGRTAVCTGAKLLVVGWRVQARRSFFGAQAADRRLGGERIKAPAARLTGPAGGPRPKVRLPAGLTPRVVRRSEIS